MPDVLAMPRLRGTDAREGAVGAPMRGGNVTGMEHAIEQAARIIHGCTGDEDGAPVAARTLAEAGWLAPAPLGREWAVEVTDPWGDLRYDRHSTREAAEDARWSDGNDRLVHRHVTAWEPADGIDRSEGGKAATGD